MVQESIDILDNIVQEAVDDLPADQSAPSSNDEPFDPDCALDDIAYNVPVLSDESRCIFPTVGEKIEVFWPDDDKYYPGTVVTNNEDTNTYQVDYDDGDQEVLNLRNEIWRSQATGISSNEIQLAPGAKLTSIERDAIKMYFEKFQQRIYIAPCSSVTIICNSKCIH